MAPGRNGPAGSNLESLGPIILLNEPRTVRLVMLERWEMRLSWLRQHTLLFLDIGLFQQNLVTKCISCVFMYYVYVLSVLIIV